MKAKIGGNMKLNDEQIKTIVLWLEGFPWVRGTTLPLKFKEDFQKIDIKNTNDFQSSDMNFAFLLGLAVGVVLVKCVDIAFS